MALYDSAEAYKAERRRDGHIIPAHKGEVTTVFTGLPDHVVLAVRQPQANG